MKNIIKTYSIPYVSPCSGRYSGDHIIKIQDIMEVLLKPDILSSFKNDYGLEYHIFKDNNFKLNWKMHKDGIILLTIPPKSSWFFSEIHNRDNCFVFQKETQDTNTTLFLYCFSSLLASQSYLFYTFYKTVYEKDLFQIMWHWKHYLK